MKRGKSAAIFLFAVALVAGCASVFGIHDLDSDSFDGGHDAQATDASDASFPDTNAPDTSTPVCATLGTPNAPDADSPGSDVTFVVAMNSIDFGITPDGGAATPVGFNLDHFCTVSVGGGNSCTTTTGNTDYTTYVVDKTSGGMDNAGFNLIGYLAGIDQGTSSFAPTAINQRLQDGQFGAIVSVEQYNGGANDTNVVVDFYPAVGLADAGAPGNFGPKDVWLADEAAIVPNLTDSIYHADTAYVIDNTLVAFFPTLSFTISVDDPAPRLTLSLNEVIVTATIVTATGSTSAFRLTNGVLAGRWATQTFLNAIAPLSLGGSTVCSQATFVSFIKSQVCNARDIMTNGNDDNMGKKCSAMSAGIAFDSYAVDNFGKGVQPYNDDDAGCTIGDCE